MKSCTEDFEHSVTLQLCACGVDMNAVATLGVAVSGGADSICLLTVLHRILPGQIKLHAVTVNHNIRPEDETCGDALFVEAYCKSLGVPCRRIEIPRGKVCDVAKMRGGGIEEAARVLRYEAFSRFMESERIDFLCLAHHRNDQLETVLMRFLQGSGAESLSGMPAVRGKYIRPLLAVSRKQIESYLSSLGISFRTDASNFDSAMLRNCIRNTVAPVLSAHVPGWETAVLSLAAKMRDDEEALRMLTEQSLEKIRYLESDGIIRFDESAFFAQSRAVGRRILFKAVSSLGSRSRIPFQLIARVLDRRDAAGCGTGTVWKENAAGIVISGDGTDIFVQKEKKLATESGFFVIIEEVGTYKAGPWTVSAECSAGIMTLHTQTDSGDCAVTVPGLEFPFAFRSRQPGDSIRNASGSFTAVSKILDDWKCGALKDCIPVLQELRSGEQLPVCIWGAAAGFKNWIVRIEK